MRAEHPLPALAAASLVLAALGSCTASTPPPAPAPVATATPRPAPTAPPAPPAPAVHWRDAPLTAGNWRWSREGALSVSRFGGDLFAMACDPARSSVTLSRRGEGGGDIPMTVVTFHQTRPLSGRSQSGRITADLDAGDALLDAMALSRGRFAIETAGLPTLYLPSWSEVTRVVEDCR